MERFRYHKKYSLHLKISLIISEAIVILLFLFSPSISTEKDETIYLDEISFVEIIPPMTLLDNYFRSKPPLPPIVLNNFIDDDIILVDVILNENKSDTSISEISTTFLNTDKNYRINSVPRQIMEVLPQQSEGKFHGSITLQLKINKNGKVSDYKILFSDINCKNCVEEIVTAAYQSTWEPALIKGKTEEYWIEKTYNFN